MKSRRIPVGVAQTDPDLAAEGFIFFPRSLVLRESGIPPGREETDHVGEPFCGGEIARSWKLNSFSLTTSRGKADPREMVLYARLPLHQPETANFFREPAALRLSAQSRFPKMNGDAGMPAKRNRNAAHLVAAACSTGGKRRLRRQIERQAGSRKNGVSLCKGNRAKYHFPADRLLRAGSKKKEGV